MRFSLLISLTGVLTAMNVIGRIYLVVLPNISPVAPLTLIAGYIGGGYIGFLVGFFSMFISDLYIGPGPWTIITSVSMGFIGSLGSLFRRIEYDYTLLWVLSFFSVLIYDVATSVILMYPFGVPPHIAILNLFIPATGYGVPYPMGPMHELTSSILFVAIIKSMKKLMGDLYVTNI